MSSIVFSTGYMGEEKKEKTRGRRRSLYLFIALLLVLLLVVEIVFQLFIAPGLVIKKIEIHCSGDFQLTDSEIFKLAGLESSRLYYFSVNTAQVEARLMQHPLVREAAVKKVFPGSMSIYLSERVPLAASLVNTGERSVPVAFDEEGVIFEIGRSLSDYNLPVISGLRFVDVKLGSRLPEELVSYLTQFKRIKESSPVLFGQISELKFINRQNAGYEVLLYPANVDIRVRTGSTIDETLLKQIFVVLDIIEKNGLKSEMDELDFRSGQVVFRTREG